jgi:hypothetical protein
LTQRFCARLTLGAKTPDIPLRGSRLAQISSGRGDGRGQVFTQPWRARPNDKRRDQVIYYQYRADRARRTLQGIDEQVAKAEKAVIGKVPVKRNQFIKPTGADKSVNRELEAKARGMAGIKGYVTNIENPSAEFVIGDDHQLWHVEESSDVQARPAGAPDLSPGAVALGVDKACQCGWPSVVCC